MLRRDNIPTIADGLAAIRSRWPEIRSSSSDEPVFVLAAGWRSGSTLIQRMLMPKCLMWGEPFGHNCMIDSMAGQLRIFSSAWPRRFFFHQGESAEELSQMFIANHYPNIDCLLNAHLEFFLQLMAKPAHDRGATRWGMKDVRLCCDHARYLKWLFPNAKFIFLVRNPYDAYRSYAPRVARGNTWYYRWPDVPLTASTMGAHWAYTAESFLTGHQEVDGILVRYEEMFDSGIQIIQDYTGLPLSTAAMNCRPTDGPPPLAQIPDSDLDVLSPQVRRVANLFGYPEPE